MCTNQESFLSLLLNQFVLLLQLLPQLVDLCEQIILIILISGRTFMKGNDIRLVYASMKFILVKNFMKASPWVLHKNANLSFSSFYHFIFIAVIQTPSQWMS